MNAQEYSDRIPFLQIAVSKDRFSLDRDLWELVDHASNLVSYVTRDLITEIDGLYFANHICQFADLLDAIESGMREQHIHDFRWQNETDFSSFVWREELEKIRSAMIHDLDCKSIEDLKAIAASWSE